jgi:hypothetical protein
VKRIFTLLLSMQLSIVVPVWAQEPSLLQLRVVQGEGTVYAAGSRATRGVTVQVTDETGKPVEGATVSFRLPESGPTGEFSQGGKTEIVNTAGDGRAEVWGMQWSRDVGSFEMRVTAAKGAARGGVVCPLYLSDAVVLRTDATAPMPEARRSRKKLWIVVGAVAAASVAVIGMAGGSSVGPTAAGAITGGVPTTIGAPTITIGRP